MTRVLVVDDEPQIRRALRAGLEAHRFTVETAGTGEDALEKAATELPDLILLDLGLPDLDGREVLERLRTWSQVPVIVVSVRDTQAEKVGALDAGADDYITKPFGMPELLARVRSTLRRMGTAPQPSPVLEFEGLRVDTARRLVQLEGEPLHLTPIEYGLLEAFVTNPGKLLTHRWLLERVWGHGQGDASHYVRVYVQVLRRKLGDRASSPRFISTEQGVGYRWLPDPVTTVPSGTDI